MDSVKKTTKNSGYIYKKSFDVYFVFCQVMAGVESIFWQGREGWL